MPITVAYESPLARIGHAGPLVLTLFRQATSIEILDELDRVQAEVVKAHGKLFSMSLIGNIGSAMKVEEPVRKKAIELGDRFESVAKGSAIVLLSKGLAAVAVRTFLTGYFLVSKSTAPTKTFSSPSEGLAFLQAIPDVDLAIKTLTPMDLELFVSAKG